MLCSNSRRAASFTGATVGMPALSSSSARPAASGASGPTIARSMPLCSAYWTTSGTFGLFLDQVVDGQAFDARVDVAHDRVDLRVVPAARKCFRNRVLPAAGTDNEDFHWKSQPNEYRVYEY